MTDSVTFANKSNKEKKYRLVETINHMSKTPITTYVIEKKKKFLFWSWWSDNYLWTFKGGNTCYILYTIEDAMNTLKILNGEKEQFERKIIY